MITVYRTLSQTRKLSDREEIWKKKKSDISLTIILYIGFSSKMFFTVYQVQNKNVYIISIDTQIPSAKFSTYIKDNECRKLKCVINNKLL